jgi:hypothetical protein
MPGAQARTAERAKALHVLGLLTCRHAEYADATGKYTEAATRYQEEALSIYRELGDKRGTAAALNELARAMGMATATRQPGRRRSRWSRRPFRSTGSSETTRTV